MRFPSSRIRSWADVQRNFDFLTTFLSTPAFGTFQTVAIPARFANGAFSKMGIDTIEYDNVNGVSLANDNYTVKKAGVYSFNMAAWLNGAIPAGPAVAVSLFVNNVETKRATTTIMPNGGTIVVVGSCQALLKVGDVVDARYLHTAGAAIAQGAFPAGCYFHGVRSSAL